MPQHTPNPEVPARVGAGRTAPPQPLPENANLGRLPMPREYVRNRAGRILGSYEDNGISGRIEARDATSRRLGYYDRRANETRDVSGRLIGNGNLLPALVFRP